MEFPEHPRLKFSEAGLRGVVGESLLPALVVEVTGAFAASLGAGPVALGRDTRLSSPLLLELAAAALRAAGREVIDLGICPVPTVEFFVKTEKLPGGLVITASHNPPEWNALKFIGPGGYFFEREEAAKLKTLYEAGVSWKRFDQLGGRRADTTAIRRHLDRILAVVDVELIRSRRFKAAYDCVNGAASVMTPLLLESLGCQGFPIHATPDLPFPHPAEPKPEHLGDLIRLTRESGADVGFAQDPDADRLAMIASEGRPLSEEYTLVLAAEHVLSRQPGRATVCNLSGSRMLEDVARRHGSTCYRTRIGEINVSKKLREVNGAIGGEGNGGVMIPEVHEGRDSFTGIALILELMATRRKSLWELTREIPQYSMLKYQETVAPECVAAAVEAVVARLGQGAELDRQDGAKLIWPDRWLHVRGSNTEPIIRLMCEAPTAAEAEELMRRARGCLAV